MAASAPSTSASALVNASRSVAASRSPASSLPAFTARSSERSIAASARATPASSASTTVTSTPERAQTSAIPEPIRPPPTTPTRIAMTLSSEPCPSRSPSSSTRSSWRRWAAARRRRRWPPPSREAGGLGFLAAGYRDAGRGARRRSPSCGGSRRGRSALNLFVPGPASARRGRARALRRGARRRGRAPRRRARRAAPRRRPLGGEARAGARGARAGRLVHVRLPGRARWSRSSRRRAARCG